MDNSFKGVVNICLYERKKIWIKGGNRINIHKHSIFIVECETVGMDGLHGVQYTIHKIAMAVGLSFCAFLVFFCLVWGNDFLLSHFLLSFFQLSLLSYFQTQKKCCFSVAITTVSCYALCLISNWDLFKYLNSKHKESIFRRFF